MLPSIASLYLLKGPRSWGPWLGCTFYSVTMTIRVTELINPWFSSFRGCLILIHALIFYAHSRINVNKFSLPEAEIWLTNIYQDICGNVNYKLILFNGNTSYWHWLVALVKKEDIYLFLVRLICTSVICIIMCSIVIVKKTKNMWIILGKMLCKVGRIVCRWVVAPVHFSWS